MLQLRVLLPGMQLKFPTPCSSGKEIVDQAAHERRVARIEMHIASVSESFELPQQQRELQALSIRHPDGRPARRVVARGEDAIHICNGPMASVRCLDCACARAGFNHFPPDA